MEARVDRLLRAGQSIWLDNLSLPLLVSGDMSRRIRQGVRGVTSNPTIFGAAIARANDYDEEIRSSGATDAEVLFWEMAIHDVQDALDLFRPIYDSSGGNDGFVSLEVSPALAHDSRATIAMARDLWNRIDRPNAMIKIPATPEGMPAIEECTAEGINVNVTLVFSVDAYDRAARAYIRGLGRRLDAGRSVEGIASANSLFISRIDTAVDALLDRMFPQATALSLRGRAGIAVAKAVYRRYLEIFDGPAFAALGARGGRRQRPLWASTGTKNRAYPDLKYVEPIVGNGTINTMPMSTFDAFLDHGIVASDAVLDGADETRQALDALEKAGIHLPAVAERLRDDGIAAFCESFAAVLAVITDRRKAPS